MFKTKLILSRLQTCRSVRFFTSPPHENLGKRTEKDTELDEINEFYSDLFTDSTQSESLTPTGTTADNNIEDLNREIRDLYGDLSFSPQEQILQNQFTEHQGEKPPDDLSVFKNLELVKSRKESLLQKLQTTEPLVIRSRSTNPFFNLSLEDKIFQLTPRPSGGQMFRRVITYTNTPCVVVGKNQNPHKETSLPLLNSLGIPMLRRFSGGGTVVHDLGNLNYCFITGREEFERGGFNNKIATYLNDHIADIGMHKEVRVNQRGDVVMVVAGDSTEYKVSGSAYRISKGKTYHHGTMLLDSNLEVLGKLLRKNKAIEGLVCSSVDSVRSRVRNLGVEKQDMVDVIEAAFDVDGTVEILEIDESMAGELELVETMIKLKSWNWSVGGAPAFKVTYRYDEQNTICFKVKKQGLLEDFTIPDMWKPHFEMLQLAMDQKLDVKFTGVEVGGFISDEKLSQWVASVIDGSEI